WRRPRRRACRDRWPPPRRRGPAGSSGRAWRGILVLPAESVKAGAARRAGRRTPRRAHRAPRSPSEGGLVTALRALAQGLLSHGANHHLEDTPMLMPMPMPTVKRYLLALAATLAFGCGAAPPDAMDPADTGAQAIASESAALGADPLQKKHLGNV